MYIQDKFGFYNCEKDSPYYNELDGMRNELDGMRVNFNFNSIDKISYLNQCVKQFHSNIMDVAKTEVEKGKKENRLICTVKYPKEICTYRTYAQVLMKIFNAYLNIDLTFTALENVGNTEDSIFPKTSSQMGGMSRMTLDVSWKADNCHVYNKINKYVPQYAFNPLKVLKSQWQAALDGRLTDVTFLVKDQKFQAHKLVLGLNLPYFKELFFNKMKESKEDKIEISECESDMFKLFLEFQYTNTVDEKLLKDINVLDSLTRLGYQYCDKDLQGLCQDKLEEWMTINSIEDVKNFKIIFDLGTTYELDNLVNNCLFTAENSENAMKALSDSVKVESIGFTMAKAAELGLPKVNKALLQKGAEFFNAILKHSENEK